MASEGQNKILQCQAVGVPQPEIRWLKDGMYLGEFTTEYFYRIQEIQRKDAGEYQCIARNSIGAIFSEKAKVTVACEYAVVVHGSVLAPQGKIGKVFCKRKKALQA